MNTPIDPLSGFRPDGYGLDDERRARMRARVLDAIPDDPPVAVASVATLANPRPVELPLVRTGADAIDASEPDDLHVLEPISLDERRSSTPSARSRRSSNGRRLLAAAAVAIALGLLAVVVGTTRSDDHQTGTLDQSSDVTLDQLADVAAGQRAATLGAGQFQYVEITSATRSADGTGLDISVDHNWHAIDGSGWRTTETMFRPAGAQPGQEIDRKEVGSTADPAGGLWFGPFSYEAMQSAPTDPAALLAAATAASVDHSTSGVAEQLMLLESLTTTPPALRAAGLRALALLGFRPLATVADPLGRPGAAYSLDTAKGTEVLVFDRTTGAALAYWSGDLGSANTVESAADWGAYSRAAITDSTAPRAG